jgi:NAD(P)-dependent dehydrogenase (short-subunit alcohol dehydrogenase family)
MDLLEGRTAVVTGAARGIGRGIAVAAADHGADVVVADVESTPPEGPPTHELVEAETDRRATHVDCDVTDPGDVEAAMEAAEAFGGVDLLVNNAGVFEPAADFFETTPQDFQGTMDVNALGTFLCSQRAAARMVAGEGGAVVNVSSVNGLLGNGKSVVYSMSKGAVKLLTYALAHRLGRTGVRVNAVHPGAVETPMTSIVDGETMNRFLERVPEGRTGTPAEIAAAVVFLGSEMASYVNGASLLVDGGYTTTGGITQPFEAYPEPSVER